MWDMMCVIIPWYLITAIEGYHQGNFSFNVLFEIISGYGTVGLSVSYSNASFSAQWSVPSKLVVIFVMLMGRHREMPDTIDAAFHDEVSDDQSEGGELEWIGVSGGAESERAKE